jgi:hypothetical protein
MVTLKQVITGTTRKTPPTSVQQHLNRLNMQAHRTGIKLSQTHIR